MSIRHAIWTMMQIGQVMHLLPCELVFGFLPENLFTSLWKRWQSSIYSISFPPLGKQFGRFWLLDYRDNEYLSKTVINVQVDVINSTCNQPKLEIDVISGTKLTLNQSLNVRVRLEQDCPISSTIPDRPGLYSLTELTAQCNNQPMTLVKGNRLAGEVFYQCQMNKCGKYHVCFFGEIKFQPSSNVHCQEFTVGTAGQIDSSHESKESGVNVIFFSILQVTKNVKKHY